MWWVGSLCSALSCFSKLWRTAQTLPTPFSDCASWWSGLGANPQEELNVGIGALAGSTIMLLTVPWALSVLGGRVSLDERGQPTYK